MFPAREARRKNFGVLGSKKLENIRKMKHFRRAKRAGFFWILGSQNVENIREMKLFGRLAPALARPSPGGWARDGTRARRLL